jgi:hypothetical protein
MMVAKDKATPGLATPLPEVYAFEGGTTGLMLLLPLFRDNRFT